MLPRSAQGASTVNAPVLLAHVVGIIAAAIALGGRPAADIVGHTTSRTYSRAVLVL